MRLPLKIRISPYLRDHRFEGRSVLPATESLCLLADSVRSHWPQRDVHVMTDAVFPRFLFIGEREEHIEAYTEIRVDGQGNLIASLLTMIPSSSRRITRAKEHASVHFPQSRPDVEPLPFSVAFRLDGTGFEITPFQLYRDLVPLGPAFQNVSGDLYLTEKGAAAQVRAALHKRQPDPLGSLFSLDAALHCACAWGQRFAGIVTFPVGFAKRFIFRPINAGEICFARIVPIRIDRESLIFDFWIYSMDSVPREAMLGVLMRDVSRGRLKPPAWVRA